MNWKIRHLTPGDWAMIATIYQEGIDSRIATFRTSLPTQEQWFSAHLPECRLILENEYEQICGFAVLSKMRGLEAYHGFAELSVYVANECQGQGGGAFLLNELIKKAKEAGFWTLVSWIFVKNEPSIRLHESCGFRKVGVHEKAAALDGEWLDVVILEKRL